jgi:uncharacterized iron-regulated membrane protein
MSLRTLHTYLGMLIAPTVLFLAFTGLLQVYSLHEAHGDYTPPPLIEKLSSVHKDQVFRLGRHAAPPAKAGPRASTAGPSAPKADEPAKSEKPKGPKPAVLILKAVFATVAVGLAVSTLLGVWMGLRQPLRRRTCAILLAIGALVPAVLIALSA